MNIQKQAGEKDSLLKIDEEKSEEVIEQPGFFHPSRRFFAYTILFMVSMYSISGYFAHDAVGVVQQQVQEALHINDQQFGLLYSIYALPNCVLPFFGGYLLDRFGIRFGTFLCMMMELLGCTIVAVGPYLNGGFWYMLVGRFLFGVGAETSYVSSHSVIMYWFRDKEIALAVSLSVSAGRIGSWFTYNINLMAVQYYGTWIAALWLGAIFVALSVIACLIYCAMDRVAEKTLREHEEIVEEPIHLQDVKNFQPHFWASCFLATLFYSVLFPFQSTAVKVFVTRYHYGDLQAGRLVSLLPFTSIFLSPFFGFLVSRWPKYAYINFIALISFVGCFAILLWVNVDPIVTIIFMSVPYSLVPACVFPYLSLVIPQQYNGTGYGLFTSIMNIGMVIIYYMQGWVMDFFHDDTQMVLLFYGGLGVGATLLNVWWIILEIRHPADLLAQTWAASMKGETTKEEEEEEEEVAPPPRTRGFGSTDIFAVPDSSDFKNMPRNSKSYGHVYDMQRNERQPQVKFLSTKFNKTNQTVENIYSGHQSLRYGSMAYGFKVVKKTDGKKALPNVVDGKTRKPASNGK